MFGPVVVGSIQISKKEYSQPIELPPTIQTVIIQEKPEKPLWQSWAHGFIQKWKGRADGA